MTSKKQLQKLGKRLRGAASPSDEDIKSLNDFRREHDAVLLSSALTLNAALAEAKVASLVSGRAKRTKSIIRKLVREPTMDLSRVTDIVGLRIVVDDLAAQEAALAVVQAVLPVTRVLDRRESDRLYRAIHVYAEFEGRKLEVQIRTLYQQLWADESESFGEQAKEGQLENTQREYLQELHDAVEALDNQADELPVLTSSLAEGRRPLEIKLARMQRDFASMTKVPDGTENKTLLVVYDEDLGSLVRVNAYAASERDEAIGDYERLMSTLDQVRFSVVLLNARNTDALSVTHPRFF